MPSDRSRIKPFTGPSANVAFSIDFLPEEIAVIDEMLAYYGGSRDEIVFKAISLLYTVFTENPETKVIFLEKGGKRIAIPIE